METVMGEDRKVKKVGMKDLQRDGWEYELTVSLTIDRDTHMAIASKDRTELFEGKDPFVITEQTGELIRQWCEKGIEPLTTVKAIATINACNDIEVLEATYKSLPTAIQLDKAVILAAKERKVLLTDKTTSNE
jgi:hypothetical protein